jgi:predicted transcriptional regulator of viral defense system
MNYADLRELKTRLYFTADDVASLLQIKSESALVLCSRYTKRGLFVRVKNNFNVLEDNWNRYANEEFFQLANFLQVPSYLSCVSALSFHGVTTQVPRGWYESVSLKRSIRYASLSPLTENRDSERGRKVSHRTGHCLQPLLYSPGADENGVIA